MSVRGVGDAFAFQRLLWLLVGTVIVPTVLLSLYGVMAIRNQQASIEEQVRQQQDERLRFAAAEAYERIAAVDVAVRTSADACGERCAVDGSKEVWTWKETPPLPLARLPLPASEPDRTVWFSPPDGTEAIGVFEVDGTVGAWRLDTEALAAVVQERGARRFPDGVAFAMRRQAPGEAAVVDELIKRWDRDEFEATAPLERPLGGWELAVSYPDNDPVRAILGPTRWLYPLGLVALVATVMAGTVITLNSAAREIRLSRLQTDFVSNVSHELRTPLTSIRLFVETLQSGRIEDPERVQECLDLLSQETDRLSRMIERVLSWAKMEAGRRTYETRPVLPTTLIDDALAAFRSQTLMSAEEVRIEIADDLPTVAVDQDAIVEALVNLLQNAVKHTEPPRLITLAAGLRDGMVTLSVSDNGPGIAPAERKRVFEKFYQADTRLSSPTGAQRGSGLGLSIVRAVATGHGGTVELASELDQGSTFTLALPVASPSR